MATQGRGSDPLNSIWQERTRYRRSQVATLYRQIELGGTADAAAIWNEWFFEAAPAAVPLAVSLNNARAVSVGSGMSTAADHRFKR